LAASAPIFVAASSNPASDSACKYWIKLRDTSQHSRYHSFHGERFRRESLNSSPVVHGDPRLYDCTNDLPAAQKSERRIEYRMGPQTGRDSIIIVSHYGYARGGLLTFSRTADLG
jgi:hypothetical protein